MSPCPRFSTTGNAFPTVPVSSPPIHLWLTRGRADFSDTYDNEVGIPYILMSKAAGHPLATYEWRTHPHKTPRTNGAAIARALTDSEKAKILRQLGRVARQLSSLRFPAIGSVFEGDEGFVVGECLHPGYVLGGRVTLEDLRRGPFHREEDFYSALATALGLHAEQLPMGHHVLRAPVPVPQEYDSFEKYCTATDRRNDFAALGGLVNSSENRLEYCLVSHLLQDLVVPAMTQAPSRSVPGFPLQHHDLSLENIFVDEELNITCIIDWSFCSTVPQAQLLSVPGLPHVRDLISDPALISAFRSGYEAENKKRGGRRVEPEDWKAGEVVSHFMRVVNLDALQDHSHLQALLDLIRGPVPAGHEESDAGGLPAILRAWASMKDSLTLADGLAFHEEHDSVARQQEKEYFDTVGPDRLALAQKVALAAKMNLSFVADSRLWRWIDAVMEDRDGRGPGEWEDDVADWTVVGRN